MRKYLVAPITLVLALAFVPGPPTEAVAAGKVVNSATGAGHLIISGERRTFAFAAVQDDSGVTVGQAQFQSRQTGQRVHVAVDCLLVAGNIATMSGVITQSNNEAIVGLNAVFRVVDNGEGKKDPKDDISLAFPTAVNTCLSAFNPTLFPIRNGNVQVR